MWRSAKGAFTLIELLVVITIVVVLLSLLSPALDRAIYQAELAVCGARLYAVAGSTLAYGFNYRRYYPTRVTSSTDARIPVINAANNGLPNNKDDRPLLAKVLKINDALLCPLVQKVDLAGSLPTSTVFSSYIPWFGFRYEAPGVNEKGMFKFGDRFTWADDAFNALASDWDGDYGNETPNHTSHPDKGGIAWNFVVQDDDIFDMVPTSPPTNKGTFSFWSTRTNLPRGLVDDNFAFDDGSVRRFMDVKWTGEDRMVRLPAFRNPNNTPDAQYQLPKS